ncbi:Transposase DDE domain-containing protein [Thermoactinomyces sp. DSM 45891]|uniref:transposase n=1 Tax=Thermoactinomyces sp. DSM 45891 TaxID=1761907 RepID=UPI00092411D3|nr:transposase [Thermoactinomyces sp. DSM 45891]SFX31455.1 Transposase DDE domain-containing protein [Thermoactinomyces sp. DSM 45891]
MDDLRRENKFFVIRLKKNAVTRDERICSVPTKESFVREDWIARLGEEVNGTIHPFRLVTFQDLEGHKIRVVTNLYDVGAEAIAGMYRARWQVELFFRWMKQHLNVKRLFGTTPNAVYGQLYAALIAYALIQWLYTGTRPAFSAVSKIVFLRKLWLGQLQAEWLISSLGKNLLDDYVKFHIYANQHTCKNTY